MIFRHPVVLTTIEEDFRAIGLLPPLTESDDPQQPREVPSPDPSTLSGLDDSEGAKGAKGPAAKQPKPSMGPADETDDEYEPVADGGSAGGSKQKGGYKAVPHGKEASIKGESKHYAPAPKQPKLGKKGIVKGGKPKVAQGLKPAKKVLGMKAEGTFGKAANLIEEVNGLLRGVQRDEELDYMIRGFGLVSESAALLADRLTEVSDVYEVDALVSEMEELSRNAVEAIDIIESDDAIAHSGDAEEGVEDMDETDENPEKPRTVDTAKLSAEDIETVFGAMVNNLMDALEAYDEALTEMGFDAEEGMGDYAEDDQEAERGDAEDDGGAEDDDDGEPEEDGELPTAAGAGIGAAFGGPVGAALGGLAGKVIGDDRDDDDDDDQGDDDDRDGDDREPEGDDDDRDGDDREPEGDDGEREPEGEGGKESMIDRLRAMQQKAREKRGEPKAPPFRGGDQGEGY